MKEHSFLTIGAIFLSAAPAAAQPAGEVGVTGVVSRLCILGAPSVRAGASGLINFRELEGTVLRVQELVDPVTLSTRAAAAEISLEAACNHPHRLRLQSQNNGLWREGLAGGAGGFAEGVPYRASLAWGELDRRLDADASGRQQRELLVEVGGPVAGELNLTLQIDPGAANTTTGAPLLAGVYSDVIRLTVEPQ